MVTCLTTLCALLAMAARENWELHQVDIIGACLQGDLSEELYIEPPNGVHMKDSNWHIGANRG